MAVLGNLGASPAAREVLGSALRRGARGLGLGVELIDVRTVEDIYVALPKLRGAGYWGFLSLGGPLNYTGRAHIVALVNELRLPAVHPFRGFVDEGGLMSFGTNRVDPFRHAATYVDKILRGQLPADLPVGAADQLRVRGKPAHRQHARTGGSTIFVGAR